MWDQSPSVGEQVWLSWMGFFFHKHSQPWAYYRKFEAQTLGFKTDSRLRNTKNFRSVLNACYRLFSKLKSQVEGDVCTGRCYCVFAMEFLLWLSGLRYKAQELCDHTSHTGFPCQYFLRFSVSHEGYTFP